MLTRVLRVIALANVAFVLVGAYDVQIAVSAFPLLGRAMASASVLSDFPYRAPAFYVMTALNALFLLALLPCSYYLWRLRPFGRVLSNVVFGTEIGFWLSPYALKFALLEWGDDKAQLLRNSIALVAPLANSGLAAQFAVWYPLMILVLLNVIYPRLHRANPATAQAKLEDTAW